MARKRVVSLILLSHYILTLSDVAKVITINTFAIKIVTRIWIASIIFTNQFTIEHQLHHKTKHVILVLMVMPYLQHWMKFTKYLNIKLQPTNLNNTDEG